MEEKDMEYLEGLKGWLEETKDTKLEAMDQFFAVRVDGYEEHMSPWKENYEWMAQIIPEDTKELLDIGCGTGLELDNIFERFPNMKVTGIDLAKSMLSELKRKHADNNLSLICEDYFVVPFGKACFDTPLTLEHEINLMKQAGFEKVEFLGYKGENHTPMIVATKKSAMPFFFSLD